MEYIRKLPFILAALMTFVIGGVSYANGVDKNSIYSRMLMSCVAFLLIGLFSRVVLNRLHEELEEKREKEKQTEIAGEIGSKIDYRVDDSADYDKSLEEEFSPLTVSEVIKTKIKED